jgi:oligopeptide transport system substrate-binding protein
MNYCKGLLTIGLLLTLTACEQTVWNDPYPARQEQANILYLSFTEQPKRLDPATAYLVNEIQIISQIYEPPLQYHYLLRPYTLIPQTVAAVPEALYFDANDKALPSTAPAEQIAYTLYEFKVKPGIYFQPHPAFAQDGTGHYVYHDLPEAELAKKYALADFPLLGTRELTAADYVYQIKRLAAPNTYSPILSLMRQYIVGIEEYAQTLETVFAQHMEDDYQDYVDLRQYPLAGVTEIDRYTYCIKINGKYPQFLYWQTMHFFSPVPWEADAFYQQPGFAQKNISLNWYPIGTGPYQLSKNNPNSHMTLARNPYFHGETYPAEGEPGDAEQGLLQFAGQSLPFLDRIEFFLEKEAVPQWNKFLQGYYDYLRLDSDTFEQAIQLDENGFSLADKLKDKDLSLQMRTSASVYYWGFNMLDPIVGGYSESARKLRQAISLAVDTDEYIAIFLNGLGKTANGPIPPDIFGYDQQQAAITPESSMTTAERLKYAKKLLAEAGYPNGINEKTNEPLILGYDVATSGSPDDKAKFGWLVKQLEKLGIEAEVRATQYSRFQQKMSNGDIQLFYWTWIGDYPDPENFLFLFYGPNAVAKTSGNNRSNYQSPEFDKLFEQMHNLDDTPERAAVIQKMVALLQQDIPWFSQLYPLTFSINNAWVAPFKPSDMIRNGLKYQKIDPIERAKKRQEWNAPVLWPFLVFGIILILLIVPVIIGYYQKTYKRN